MTASTECSASSNANVKNLNVEQMSINTFTQDFPVINARKNNFKEICSRYFP